MGIVLAILLFGFIVFFHELGHFLLARINGINVYEFWIGMGPTLAHKKIGNTDYCLKILPIGGEAQRIKLATELSRRSTGKTVYILDEPTTGLHFADVHKLTEILRRLAADGNTVIVIEHNLDVIKTADYIIDIGPEGGDKGGTVVACGTPEEVAENPNSYTGKYIKMMLDRK